MHLNVNEDMDTQPDKQKIDKFLDTLSGYFSVRTTPTGFYHTIGEINQKLGGLLFKR